MALYYVGWSESPDEGTFQILGDPMEAEKGTDAIDFAARNHQQPGRYMAIAEDRMTQRDVTFNMEPVLSKPPAAVDPAPETPPEEPVQ